MKRVTLTPREGWQQKCEDIGFSFHSMPSENGEPYWRESAAYEFNLAEIEGIERVTGDLFARCMDAVEFVVRKNRFEEFAIPKEFWPLIKASWDEDDATVFGRFDLALSENGRHKLLEFNADTPTSLIESSAAQWFWLKDTYGDSRDQFNSLHEHLIEQWRHIRVKRWRLPEGAPLYMASLGSNADGTPITEDHENVGYMAETARQAGFAPRFIFVEQIAWSEQYGAFIDPEGRPIRHIYKLYPWEWMINEAYARQVITSIDKTHWVEPLWKTLLSNKQLLVILWELFPDHLNLLPTFNSDVPLMSKQRVRKPKLGREGANVGIFGAGGQAIELNEGEYGAEGYVWQEYVALPEHGGWQAVCGSWIVGETPAGIGMRESSSLITNDGAFFVPHSIVG